MGDVVQLHNSARWLRSRPGVPTGNATASVASAVRFAIDDARPPELTAVLEAWFALAGPNGRFRLGVDGSEADLRRSPTFMSGRSTIMLVNAGTSPLDWRIAHWGPGYQRDWGIELLCGRLRDIRQPLLREVTAQSLAESVETPYPAAYRIIAPGDVGTAVYDVLRLPVVDRRGRVTRFLNKSHTYVSMKGEVENSA